MRVFASADQVLGAVGERFGPTDWIELTPERCDTFARATTAADGSSDLAFLVLALVPRLLSSLVRFERRRLGINYGLNGARFAGRPGVGARIRAEAELIAARPVGEGAGTVEATWRVTVETEAASEPTCVAETVSRYVFGMS